MFQGGCLRSLLVVLCLGHWFAGCSSFDENTPDHLDFALPNVSWAVSPNHPQWRDSPPANAMPPFICAGREGLVGADCCAPPYDCQRYPLACDPNTNSCAVTFDVELTDSVDLVDSGVIANRGWVFSRVELLGPPTLAVDNGGLPIRAAKLYLGPQGMSDSSDPAATLLAMADVSRRETSLVLDPLGQGALLGALRSYPLPFALLLSIQVVLPRGAVGQGTWDATLTCNVRAFY